MDKVIAFHTSGSTGTPKVIQKTVDSLRLDATMLASAFRAIFEQQPTFVASIQTQHMYGKLWLETLQPLVGCPRHVEQVDGWETFFKCQECYDKVVFITTPSFLAELVSHRHQLTPKRNVLAIFTAGSLLRTEVSQAVEALFGVSPIEIYGSTETGSVAWRQQCNGSSWTIFDGVTAVATPEETLAVTSPFCVSTPYILQDRVTFEDERHFLLHGRTDRYVKILEHFVALAEIEEGLRKHPYVADCHAVASPTDVSRIWTLIVPSEEGKTALIEQGYQAVTRTLRLEASTYVPSYAVPRRMRFVRTLPYTTQGKLPVSVVIPRFEVERQEPVVTQWDLQGETLAVRFAYPHDVIFFQGHFPNAPILPGVAQLFTVRHFIQQAFNVQVDGAIKRLKFQQPILPKQEVCLTVKRKTPTSFDFTLQTAQGPCASGILSVREEGC